MTVTPSDTDVSLGADDPTPSKSAGSGSGRFSAYDTRYLRYVGGVHESKSAAKSAAKDAGVPASSTRVDEV